MERSRTIDYFKIILSILVITIHTQPLFSSSSLAGWLISNGIARIAVPIFFIISGYFISEKLANKAYLKKYLLHLLVVFGVWSLIYLPFYIDTIDARSLITFALMGYYHLWFVPALIVGLLLLKVVSEKIKNEKIILASGIILYFVGSCLEQYTDLYYRVYCNGIFFGYPFVALGYVIRKRNWEKNFNSYLLYGLLTASFVLLILQSYLSYVLCTYNNMYIALYVFCGMSFTLILRYSKTTDSSHFILNKVASGIYFIHVLVLTEIIPLSDTYNIYKLPLITVISILLSIFIAFINKRIKILL